MELLVMHEACVTRGCFHGIVSEFALTASIFDYWNVLSRCLKVAVQH